jgi:hypothetical protein
MRDGKPSNFVDESKMVESTMLSGTPKVRLSYIKILLLPEFANALDSL